jgi:hypothetical protein
VTASAILMLIRGAPAAAASSGRVAPGPMPKNSVFPLEPGTGL